MKKSVLLFIAVTLGGWGLSGGRALAAGSSTNALAISIQIEGAIPNTVAVTNHGVVTTTYSSTPIKLDNEDLLILGAGQEYKVGFVPLWDTGYLGTSAARHLPERLRLCDRCLKLLVRRQHR